jgi:hypothetical protein
LTCHRAATARLHYLIVEGDGVEGDGVERHELDRWYHRIDLNGLRGELDKLQRTAASR